MKEIKNEVELSEMQKRGAIKLTFKKGKRICMKLSSSHFNKFRLKNNNKRSSKKSMQIYFEIDPSKPNMCTWEAYRG